MRTVSDFIFDYLWGIGIRRIFFLPGGGAMFLNDSMLKSKMKSTLCLHEQSVAIAAEYYGRISEEPFGVCLVTNGPGATNTITAVSGAYIESVPLLVICGQVKRDNYFPQKKVRQTGVQEVATLPMVKSITKYSSILLDETRVKEEMDICVRNLISGRKGPVWLEIPLDVQAASCVLKIAEDEPKGISKEENYQLVTYKTPNLRDNRRKKYKRPLILIGQGVRHSGCHEDVRVYIREKRIPVTTTFPSKDFIAFDNKLFVGHPGNVALRAANIAIQNCDVLISIGSSLNNVVTGYNPSNFAKQADLYVFNIDEEELRVLDIKHAIKHVMGPIEAIEWLNHNVDFDEDTQAEWLDYLTAMKFEFSYPKDMAFEDDIKSCGMDRLSLFAVVNELGCLLRNFKYIITGSSGLCIEAFYVLYRNEEGQRIVIDSGLGSMGYGLPGLIGACMARPRDKIILYEGDGSLQMNIQELATISGNQLNCCILLINNDGYASIKNSQSAYFSNRFAGCNRNSGLFLPDVSMIAEAYSIDYYSVNNLEELRTAMDMISVKEGASIVEIFTNPDVVLQPRVKSVRTGDGSMKSLPIEDMYPFIEISNLRKWMKYADIHEEAEKARAL